MRISGGELLRRPGPYAGCGAIVEKEEHTALHCSWVIAVNISDWATGWRPSIVGSMFCRHNKHSSNVKTFFWGTPSLLFSGYRRFLPRVYSGRGVKLTTHPSSGQAKNEWSHTASPPMLHSKIQHRTGLSENFVLLARHSVTPQTATDVSDRHS